MRIVVEALRISFGNYSSIQARLSNAKGNLRRGRLLHSAPMSLKPQRLWNSQRSASATFRGSTFILHPHNDNTHDINTAFSAVMRSCRGLKSEFPPKDGRVELWAIFVAAVLNIVVAVEECAQWLFVRAFGDDAAYSLT